MEVRYAIVLSPGRTGTKWLAGVLARDPGIAVSHEHPGDLEAVVAGARRREIAIKSYADIVARRMHGAANGHRAVIEVNGLLRYHTDAIGVRLGKLRLAYLARDGMMTVASIAARRTTRQARQVIDYIGREGADDFERICFYWMRTSRLLWKICDRTWNLERITTDFNAFQEAADFLGARIDSRTWESWRSKKINSSKNRPNLTAPQKDTFRKICASDQWLLGYDLK
jgi:hypothetical protein